METLNKRLREFDSWADEQINPKMIGAPPNLFDELLASLKLLSELEEKAIAKLKEDLQQCRMRSWAEIAAR
jgi:hypothetical protein